MTRKTFLFIIIGFIILLAAGGLLLVKKNQPTSTTGSSGGIHFRDFLPFGPKQTPTTEEETPTPEDTGGSITPITPEDNVVDAELKQITPESIAGYTLIEQTTKVEGSAVEAVVTKEAVRYVDSTTGNIKDIFPDTLETKNVTNQTIPGIHRAEFGNKGTSIVANYLKPNGAEVETIYGTILTDETGGVLQATVLPKDTFDFSISPDGKKFFYLFRFDTGSVGNTIAFDTKKKTTVFESPYVEWKSLWGENERITLTTKPSGVTPGFSYALNPTTKTMGRILGNVSGLTALYGPTGDNALYASGSQNSMSLYAYKQKSGAGESAPFVTMPQKCVFASETKVYCAVPNTIPTALYPDSWYQGLVSFDDTIVLFDLGNFSQRTVGNPSVAGFSVDAIDLKINKAGTELFFKNKKDGSLWMMKLPTEQ